MQKTMIRRYSQPFKMQVIAEYENGASVPELRQKYGIKGSNTIQTWVQKYAREAYRSKVIHIQKTEEYLELKMMKKRLSEMESALSESVLENRMLKATIEAADEALKIDLKKTTARNNNSCYSFKRCHEIRSRGMV